MPILIVITGPTAIGKTDLAIQVARQLNTHILSCDSRQFYREMNIGTAKPTLEELAAAPHHFINSLSVTDAYSVGDYERDALAKLESLFQTHEQVILTGGSGLFIKAVCEGLDRFPDIPVEVRKEIETWYETKGIEALQEELQQVDSAYYSTVDLSNPHRLIRALSVYRASGQPFSSFRRQAKVTRPFKIKYILLEREREELYDRINKRADLMLEMGLETEVRSLLPYRNYTALQTVAYQEFFDFFDGKIDDAECVRLIKRNTRRYAKRQLTWFRQQEHWQRFPATDTEAILTYIKKEIAS
ncbi:MAG: tRNA (adenosine(37)-N6)-dimethylallyltransferase MiaA [Bacteroidota bacterium]